MQILILAVLPVAIFGMSILPLGEEVEFGAPLTNLTESTQSKFDLLKYMCF